MQGGKLWFSAESKRAGWISVFANIALFALLAWSFRNARSPLFAFFLYPAFAIALGVVGVGVMNWRHWRGFRESMAASFQAALAAYKIIGMVLLPLVFVASLSWGPVVAFVLMFYVIAALLLYLFYVALSFLVVMLLACGGGAVLYGLLVVMRFAASIGREKSAIDEPKPRPLASVSL